EPRPLDDVGDRRDEPEPQGDYEQRAQLERRSGDGDDPLVSGSVEGDRIGEDVRRPGKGNGEDVLDREGDRDGRRDPTEGRTADEVLVDDGEIAPGTNRGRGDERDGEADDEAPARGRRGGHRPPAGGHEQSDEDAEADEVAEREVDDSGQPED